MPTTCSARSAPSTERGRTHTHGQQGSPARTAAATRRPDAASEVGGQFGRLVGGGKSLVKASCCRWSIPARSSRLAAPTPVPHTATWYRGVVSLRGNLYGVIDLGVFLGLKARQHPAAPDQRPGPPGHAECRVECQQRRARRPPPPACAAPTSSRSRPGPHPRPSPCSRATSIRDESQRLWQELRLHQLIRNEHFLRIEA